MSTYLLWIAPTDQGPWSPAGSGDSTALSTLMNLVGNQMPKAGRQRWIYAFDSSLQRANLIDTLTQNRWASNDSGQTWRSIRYT